MWSDGDATGRGGAGSLAQLIFDFHIEAENVRPTVGTTERLDIGVEWRLVLLPQAIGVEDRGHGLT
jgi:hypothetical protein